MKYVIDPDVGPKYKRAMIPTLESRLDYDGYAEDLLQTVWQFSVSLCRWVEDRGIERKKRQRFK